jgi:LAGLIDADG DNA endonuclease family
VRENKNLLNYYPLLAHPMKIWRMKKNYLPRGIKISLPIGRRSLFTNLNSKLKNYPVSTTSVTKNMNSQNLFHTRCRAINRIGPHNLDVISVMVGLLLGDGYLNNRTGEGVRMAVKQSIVHKEYLFSLYEFFYKRGYCTSLEPRLYTRRISGKVKFYYGYEFNTFTFRSLVWLHELFYSNGKKIIPANISDLITPLALAI